eukprot:gene24846-10500_t
MKVEMMFAGRICGGREIPNGNKEPCCRKISSGYSQGRICGGRKTPNGNKVPCCRKISSGYSQGRICGGLNPNWNEYHRACKIAQLLKVASVEVERSPMGTRCHAAARSAQATVKVLSHTRFCLAPTGGGHGHRQILVAFSGCVPLLIGDYVLQPFEPELDWTRFSVTVAQADIPQLHDILGAVTDEQHTAMKRNLRCAGEHLSFSSFIGGFKWEDGRYDAYETVMEILRVRLLYPDAKPGEFSKLDKDFAAFMECRLPSASKEPDHLCSLSEYDGKPCLKCINSHHGFVPGGVMCCSAPDPALTSCHRPWA